MIDSDDFKIAQNFWTWKYMSCLHSFYLKKLKTNFMTCNYYTVWIVIKHHEFYPFILTTNYINTTYNKVASIKNEYAFPCKVELNPYPYFHYLPCYPDLQLDMIVKTLEKSLKNVKTKITFCSFNLCLRNNYRHTEFELKKYTTTYLEKTVDFIKCKPVFKIFVNNSKYGSSKLQVSWVISKSVIH